MERFYFEIPSLERKEDIIDYLNEFVEYKSDINGTGSLNKIFDGYTFEQALERNLNLSNEEYAHSINKAPSKTFLLIRENDNKVIGTINVRWNLPELLLRIGGHIGYSIRPTERKKGYAKIQLYMGLIEANKMGLDKVMLSCYIDNLGSNKTIKALGGVFEKIENDYEKNKMVNNYWIDVKKSLNEYKDYLKMIK